MPSKLGNSLDILVSEDTNIQLLDSIANEFTEVILVAARASIPLRKLGGRPKPWWSPELKELRKEMLKAQRALKKDYKSYSLVQAYLQARNSYFQAIKQAKRDHWNNFLEKEDPKSIFKAMGYTKEYRIERTPPIQKETPTPTLANSF